METNTASVRQILTAQTQYIVPEYQRNYSWDKPQWERLWNDLMTLVLKLKKTPGEDYFFGVIVRYPKNSFVPVSQCWLIDGQQRTTTIIILLTALRDSAPSAIKGLDDCIKNARGVGALEKKLVPKKNDRATLNALIDKTAISGDGRIKQAYEYFLAKAQTLPANIVPDDILNALDNLKMVDIEIQNEDPQVIFETLNSTGRDLGPADKIRNFVMMGLNQTDREKLLINFWDKLDDVFSGIPYYESEIDEFIRRYLVFKLKRKVKWDFIYDEFRQYVTDQKASGKTIFDICNDILTNAEYYIQFLDPSKCKTGEREYFEDLLYLKQTTQYPLLLLLNETQTPVSDKCVILQLIVSYFIRRTFCNLSDKSANTLFIKLLSKIRQGSELQDFKNYFQHNATWPQRFPDDNEFEKNWPTFDLYQGRVAQYVLSKLEKMNNQGYSISANSNQGITVEHIRPQNPTPPAWPISTADDEEIHHIGNLTLTANNSELGNKSFADKKVMPKTVMSHRIVLVGYNASPYTYLMRDVLSESQWTKTEMDKRAQRLWEGVIDPVSGKRIGVLPKDIWPFI